MGIKDIDDKYIDMKYYYFHKALEKIRNLFNISLPMGDFYFTYGKDDDTKDVLLT